MTTKVLNVVFGERNSTAGLVEAYFDGQNTQGSTVARLRPRLLEFDRSKSLPNMVSASRVVSLSSNGETTLQAPSSPAPSSPLAGLTVQELGVVAVATFRSWDGGSLVPRAAAGNAVRELMAKCKADGLKPAEDDSFFVATFDGIGFPEIWVRLEEHDW